MNALENFLYGVFSAEIGMSEEMREEQIAKTRDRADPSERLAIRNELLQAFGDPNFDWVALLDSRYFIVASVTSNTEGKRFILDNIWAPLFPGEEPAIISENE